MTTSVRFVINKTAIQFFFFPVVESTVSHVGTQGENVETEIAPEIRNKRRGVLTKFV